MTLRILFFASFFLGLLPQESFSCGRDYQGYSQECPLSFKNQVMDTLIDLSDYPHNFSCEDEPYDFNDKRLFSFQAITPCQPEGKASKIHFLLLEINRYASWYGKILTLAKYKDIRTDSVRDEQYESLTDSDSREISLTDSDSRDINLTDPDDSDEKYKSITDYYFEENEISNWDLKRVDVLKISFGNIGKDINLNLFINKITNEIILSGKIILPFINQ